MTTTLVTNNTNFSQTDFQGYSYINVYIYGAGGGSTQANTSTPSKYNDYTSVTTPACGAGSGGYIAISNVPVNSLASITAVIGLGGQVSASGGNTSVTFVYSDGRSYTYTAGGGGGVSGSNSSTPGYGGQNSISSQIPGTSCNSVNGVSGGAIGASGSGNGYTSSGSGSSSDSSTIVGVPPKYTQTIYNVTVINQGAGSNTLPSGYGSGAAGTPANYNKNAPAYKVGTSGAVVFYMK